MYKSLVVQTTNCATILDDSTAKLDKLNLYFLKLPLRLSDVMYSYTVQLFCTTVVYSCIVQLFYTFVQIRCKEIPMMHDV